MRKFFLIFFSLVSVPALAFDKEEQLTISLYEKMGFVVNGRRKNYYEAPIEDAVLMMHEA